MNKRALKVSLGILLALMLLWGVTEMAAPLFGVRYVREKIQSRYPDIGSIQISLKAFPAFKLAFRRYDLLKIELDSVPLAGFSFSRLRLESREWPRAKFEAVLSEREINRFFTLQSTRIENAAVRLEKDAAVVTGNVRTSIGPVETEARGYLISRQGRFVHFVPQEVSAGAIELGRGFLESLRAAMNEAPIYVIRKDLPYTVNSIDIAQNRMTIRGAVDLDRALGLSSP